MKKRLVLAILAAMLFAGGTGWAQLGGTLGQELQQQQQRELDYWNNLGRQFQEQNRQDQIDESLRQQYRANDLLEQQNRILQQQQMQELNRPGRYNFGR
jgi:Ni/Co efflux regulator RcnB